MPQDYPVWATLYIFHRTLSCRGQVVLTRRQILASIGQVFDKNTRSFPSYVLPSDTLVWHQISGFHK